MNLKRSLISLACWWLNFTVSRLNPSQELEDYFYYVQLRSQGIDALETRQVSTHIPLEEIPSVMRAMGFYPSEEEVCQMFLLLLKKKRARLIAFTEQPEGQIQTLAMLDCSQGISAGLNVFSLVCISAVVIRIWQQTYKTAMAVESWVSEDELRKLRNDVVDKLAMVLGNLLVGGGWTR